MESNVVYEDILGMLAQIKDDEKKLMAVFTCLKYQVEANKPEEKSDLLRQYENTILQIADAVYSGAICYLNPETMEVESIQPETYFDSSDMNDQSDEPIDEFGLNVTKWNKFIRFKLPENGELLNMMERYVSELKDSILGSKLVSALDDYTPISSFLKVISACEYNEDWLRFRKKETIAYVNSILTSKLRLAKI